MTPEQEARAAIHWQSHALVLDSSAPAHQLPARFRLGEKMRRVTALREQQAEAAKLDAAIAANLAANLKELGYGG